MKQLLFRVALVGWCLSGISQASNICPTTSNTTSDCNYIVTYDANGVSGMVVPNQTPYDGDDDALIGVVNNSNTYLTEITLSGVGNGGGLFDFDGDGICDYITCVGGTFTDPNGYQSYDPSGYAGPQNSFTNITIDPQGYRSLGTVVFNGQGLAPGATTFFSLEDNPATVIGGIGVGGVPEPGSVGLMVSGIGFLGVAMFWRSRRNRRAQSTL